MTYDFRWAITEPVDITETEDGLRIVRTTRPGNMTLSGDSDGKMLFNGQLADVGDDMISFVSLIDDYYSMGGEHGKTIRSEPFDEPGHGYWDLG